MFKKLDSSHNVQFIRVGLLGSFKDTENNGEECKQKPICGRLRALYLTCAVIPPDGLLSKCHVTPEKHPIRVGIETRTGSGGCNHNARLLLCAM